MVIIVDEDPDDAPVNASPAQNAASGVTCSTIGCAEDYCEAACARLEECVSGQRADCIDICGWLADSYSPDQSESDCPTAAARLYDCVARASCGEVEAWWEVGDLDTCAAAEEVELTACYYDFVDDRTVTVDILGALIAPAKSNRAPWDGLGGGVSADDWATFIDLVGQLAGSKLAPGTSSVVGRILDIVNRVSEPPDPAGLIEWDYGAGWMDAQELVEIGDTFTPQWRLGGYTFDEGSGARWNVDLWDVDLTSDDPISSVILTEDQIVAAAEAGGQQWIIVGDTFNPQLVAIKVSATFR